MVDAILGRFASGELGREGGAWLGVSADDGVEDLVITRSRKVCLCSTVEALLTVDFPFRLGDAFSDFRDASNPASPPR